MTKHRIKIKPLSVNQAWQGKRFKTPKYKAYRERCQWLLKPVDIPEGDLWLQIQFGVSNMACDVDNLLKPWIDALQDRYKFNDNRITKITATKVKAAKGSEFIEWSLTEDKIVEPLADSTSNQR